MKRVPQKFIDEPTGYPFSPVMAAQGREIVVTAGICCDDLDGQIPEDMESQARNTLQACANFLAEAGCGLEDVFNVEVYMKDIADWDAFNLVYREMIPEPMPCRKVLQVGLLPGYLVEVVMWAVKD